MGAGVGDVSATIGNTGTGVGVKTNVGIWASGVGLIGDSVTMDAITTDVGVGDASVTTGNTGAGEVVGMVVRGVGVGVNVNVEIEFVGATVVGDSDGNISVIAGKAGAGDSVTIGVGVGEAVGVAVNGIGVGVNGTAVAVCVGVTVATLSHVYAPYPQAGLPACNLKSPAAALTKSGLPILPFTSNPISCHCAKVLNT